MRFSETTFSLQEANYGQLESFRHDAFHRWECLGFSTAQILFEAQRDLYLFLRDSLRFLLEIAKAANTGDVNWRAQATEGFRACAPKGSKPQARLLYEPIQHLEPPLQFDLNSMEEIIDERQTAAEEELWLLQTDPAHSWKILTNMLQGTYDSGLDPKEQLEAIAYDFSELAMRRARTWNIFRRLMRLLKHFSSKGAEPFDHTLDFVYSCVYDEMRGIQCFITRNLLEKDYSFDDNFVFSKRGQVVHLTGKEKEPFAIVFQDDQHCFGQPLNLHKEKPLFWALLEEMALLRSTLAPMLTMMSLYLNDCLEKYKLDAASASSPMIKTLIDLSALQMLRASLEAHRPRFLERSEEIRCQFEDDYRDEMEAAGYIDENDYITGAER